MKKKILILSIKNECWLVKRYCNTFQSNHLNFVYLLALDNKRSVNIFFDDTSGLSLFTGVVCVGMQQLFKTQSRGKMCVKLNK